MKEPKPRNKSDQVAYENFWQYVDAFPKGTRVYNKYYPNYLFVLRIPPGHSPVEMQNLWHCGISIVVRIDRARWIRSAPVIEQHLAKMLKELE